MNDDAAETLTEVRDARQYRPRQIGTHPRHPPRLKNADASIILACTPRSWAVSPNEQPCHERTYTESSQPGAVAVGARTVRPAGARRPVARAAGSPVDLRPYPAGCGRRHRPGAGYAAGRHPWRDRLLRAALSRAGRAHGAARLHRPFLCVARRGASAERGVPARRGRGGRHRGRRQRDRRTVALPGPLQLGRIGQCLLRPAGGEHHLCPCHAGQRRRAVRRSRAHHRRFLERGLCRRRSEHHHAAVRPRPAHAPGRVPGRRRNAGAAHRCSPTRRRNR